MVLSCSIPNMFFDPLIQSSKRPGTNTNAVSCITEAQRSRSRTKKLPPLRAKDHPGAGRYFDECAHPPRSVGCGHCATRWDCSRPWRAKSFVSQLSGLLALFIWRYKCTCAIHGPLLLDNEERRVAPTSRKAHKITRGSSRTWDGNISLEKGSRVQTNGK